MKMTRTATTSMMAIALLLSMTMTAWATHVTPTFVSGNATCAQLLSNPDAQEIKIQPVVSGTYGPITITVNNVALGQTVDWTSTIGIDAVFVKGGPVGNLYTYNPPAPSFGDTGLHAPINSSNGKYYGLSHLSFCFVPRPGTALSLSGATSPLTIHSGDNVTLTFAELNDGTVPLTTPSVSTNLAACTPTFLSGDTNTNGVLDPGETWLFRCTITNVTSDVTVTAIGHGFYNGNDVTWCANPGTPPANTTCDQDERTQVAIDVINPSTDLDLSGTADPVLVYSGGSAVLTFAEANDGDVPLTSPSVTTDNSGCAPTYLSGDGNTNGILDAGETWLFRCTVTNITSDVTVTATGHGTDPLGFDVTWCSNPSTPPTNTICDQDERTQVAIDVINSSTTLALSSTANPTVILSGASVVITFAEDNDGDVELESPSVTTDNAGCAPAYLSGDTNTDGDLDTNETWLFRCTMTNVTSDVTVTAFGHGIDPLGNDVTWCSDPAVPPANTRCDQDERTQVSIDVVNPNTTLTLSGTANPTVILSGGTAVLTFSEDNSGDVQLTNPSVTTNNAGCVPAYLSGDTNTDGDLDTNETWLFRCTMTNVTSDVTVTAIGHGLDPFGNDVTWCSDPANPPANTICDQDERTQVAIDVVNPSTTLTLSGATSPITVSPGDNVTLTFAEDNDGDVELENPSVTANNGCTPVYTSGDTNVDGDLDTNETWLFQCTLTNLTSDVTITAIGHGLNPFGQDVTWCSDPGNPPANTQCDQDERTVVVIQVVGEGCTPGFWRNHTNLWDGAGSDDVTNTIQTTDGFNATFGVTSAQSGQSDSLTLLQAVNLGGGDLKALARHAAAAAVNADSGIDYAYTLAQVIAIYQDAVTPASGSETVASALAKFSTANEEGCPLT